MSLSPALITETARSLLIRYGLPDVSMRRLAKELGVAPGALYYHVSSKQVLLTRVAQEILAPLRAEAADARTLMLRLRELMLPLRDSGDLLLLAYALDPRLPPAHVLPAQLRAQGWSEAEASRTTAAVMRFALGAIATEQNQRLLDAEQDTAVQNTADQNPGEAADEDPRAVEAEQIYLHGLEALLARPSLRA